MAPFKEKDAEDKKVALSIEVYPEKEVFIEERFNGTIKNILKEKPPGANGRHVQFSKIPSKFYKFIDPTSFSNFVEKSSLDYTFDRN